MAPHPLTAAPLPVLVFDGDCPLCTTSAGVITPTYTPAYATHDLFVTWKPETGVLEGMDVTLTVENVFDADYKNNLSLDRAQGMNAKLSIGKNFTW